MNSLRAASLMLRLLAGPGAFAGEVPAKEALAAAQEAPTAAEEAAATQLQIDAVASALRAADEDVRRERNKRRECESAFSIAAFSAAARQPGFPKEVLAVPGFDWAVINHQICRALQAKSPEPCRALDSFLEVRGGANKMGRENCVDGYDDHTLFHAILAGDPSAQAACLGMRRQAPYKTKEGCAILARSAGDSKALCDRLLAQLGRQRDAASLASCAARFDADFGRACEAPGLVEGKRELCRNMAAFRKASQSRDVGACGDSGICRLWVGAGPKSCDSYFDNIRGSYCAALADEPKAVGLPANYRALYGGALQRLRQDLAARRGKQGSRLR